MEELNTITDFLDYLKWKEEAFTNGGLESAESELDLLAFFLENRKVDGRCPLPRPGYAMRFVPGAWENLRASEGYRKRVESNKVSYFIDELVESLTRSVAAGDVLPDYPEGFSLADLERVVRALARECRTTRRMLGEAFLQKIRTTGHNRRSMRFLRPHRKGDPAYVLVTYPRHSGRTEEETRNERFAMLVDYCLVAKLRFLDTEDVTGIATEPGTTTQRSFDAFHLGHALWTPEVQQLAKQTSERAPFFKYGGDFDFYTKEFPSGGPPLVGVTRRTPQSSTGRCPCGSGKRFAKCHGRW